MTTTPHCPATVSEHLLSIEPGLPGPQAAERWSARAAVLAAWLASEWQREQAGVTAAESTAARLDPAPCAATPRQEVAGAPEAV